MITEGWLRELGVLVWNLTQFTAAIIAAVSAYKALNRAKAIETKTDGQTATLQSIDRKADDAVTTAATVEKKADEQASKLDEIVGVTATTADQTNGHLSVLRDQVDSLSKQYITALESHQKQLLTALSSKQAAEAAMGGRRRDDQR